MLHPLEHLGAPICGNQVFAYIYNSHKFHQIDYAGGMASNDYNVLETDFGILGTMHTGGAGVMTSSASVLNTLTLGANFSGAGIGVFVNGHGNSVFGQGVNVGKSLNYLDWDATQTGGTPSVANPMTLTESPSNLATANGNMSILVP